MFRALLSLRSRGPAPAIADVQAALSADRATAQGLLAQRRAPALSPEERSMLRRAAELE